MKGLEAAPGREYRENGGWGTDEGQAGQESEFSRVSQGLPCEKAPRQGSEGTQSPALIQQEEEDLPSLKEEATECNCCTRLKSSMNPPRPQEFYKSTKAPELGLQG